MISCGLSGTPQVPRLVSPSVPDRFQLKVPAQVHREGQSINPHNRIERPPPPSTTIPTDHVSGSLKTHSRRRRSVKGRIMRPYWLCLKSPRRRSASDQI